jgi:hypothetical protein
MFSHNLRWSQNYFQPCSIKTLVKLEYRFRISSESYLSCTQLLSKKLGVQIEVVLGSPQAHVPLARCLWMAENEQQLQGEKYESSSNFPLAIRSPCSGGAPQNAKALPKTS